VGCLALATIDIDFGEMAEALRSANPAWIATAAGTVLLTGWAKAWRWHLLLYPAPSRPGVRPQQQPADRIGLPRLTNIWMAGAGVNLALPVPRGGDVLRVYLAGEAGGVSKSLVLGTIAAEKLLDMVLLAVCFVGLLLLMAMPQELAQRQTSTVGVTLLLTSGSDRAAMAA
jgi:glycosyltransferase 2 family protein